MATLLDSYTSGNVGLDLKDHHPADTTANSDAGQETIAAFGGDGYVLDSGILKMRKAGAPTGTGYLVLEPRHYPAQFGSFIIVSLEYL